MKMRIFALILLSALLISCGERSTEAIGNSTVSGTIRYNSNPIANATVRLSNSQRYEITLSTDENGSFEFQSVPNGDYELNYTKMFENGSYVERSNEISVEENCNFENLILPAAVEIYEPLNITHESLDLSWSPSNAPDFREYKIYRGLTSGLDENTGLLVHVSTSYNDTLFTNDDLDPFETYYYRVYVMNNYGILGGSNIVSATTENQDILANSSFEIIDSETSFPENWDQFLAYDIPAFSVDSLIVYDGTYSVNMSSGDDHVMDYVLYQDIPPSSFVPGTQYKFSFWMKSDTTFDPNTFSIYLREENTQTVLIDESPVISSISDWHQYSYEFTVPNIPNAQYFRLSFSFCLWHHEYQAWFDKTEIIRIE